MTYFITRSLYLLTTLTHFAHSLPLAATKLFFSAALIAFQCLPMELFLNCNHLGVHAFNLLMPLSWTTDSVCVLITGPVGFRSLHSFCPFEPHLTLQPWGLCLFSQPRPCSTSWQKFLFDSLPCYTASSHQQWWWAEQMGQRGIMKMDGLAGIRDIFSILNILIHKDPASFLYFPSKFFTVSLFILYPTPL